MAAVTAATKIVPSTTVLSTPWNDIVQEMIDAKGAYATLKARVDALTAAPSSEWVESGQTPTFVSSTRFTVPTDLTTKFEVDRRIQAELAAGTLVYSHVTVVSFASNTTTVDINNTVLTSALSKVWYSFFGTGSDRAYPDVGGVPSGGMIPYGGAAAPSGWLLCDGTAVSRTTYANLFIAISTTYGTGDGSTTFNLPDMRGRFPLGKAASGTGSTLGGTGGAIDHTHTGPSHTHTGPSHTHTYTDVPNHVHSVDPPSTAASITDPGHFHTASYNAGGSGTHPTQGTTGSVTPTAINNTGSATTGITASVDIAAFNSANPTGGVATGTTAASGTAATGADGTAVTGTGNPPFQAFNYIIKQ